MATCGFTFANKDERQMSRICRTAALLTVGVCLSTCSCGQTSDSDGAVNNPVADSPQSADTAPAASKRKNTDVNRVNGSPVSATLTIEPSHVKRGEQVAIKVRLEIEPLWEIREVGNPTSIMATWLDLKLPNGIAALGDWNAPRPIRSISPDGHPVYVDEAEFNRQLLVQPELTSGEILITCRVHFQACNDRQCLEPTAVKLTSPLKGK
jgi:hypothetical protein